MDALANLRAEIAKKRKSAPASGASTSSKPAQKRWKRNADFEAERERKYLEDEERHQAELERKRLRKRKEADELTASLAPAKPQPAEAPGEARKETDKLSAKRDGEPPLNKKEVFRLLRAKGEPVTLFGEGDWERFDRLKQMQLEAEETGAGQRNVFQKKMRELQAQTAVDDVYRYVGADLPQAPQPAASANNVNQDPDEHHTKENFVSTSIRRYVTVWQSEIDAIPSEERRTRKGRDAVVRLEQTKEWLKPLHRLLLKQKLKKEVLSALHNIFLAVEEREYVKANSIYLEELAIGNAPWPMGATMVGIHARAAREKIGEDKIAHVMNDEMTRKYIQAVKRLVTVAQRHFPRGGDTGT